MRFSHRIALCVVLSFAILGSSQEVQTDRPRVIQISQADATRLLPQRVQNFLTKHLINTPEHKSLWNASWLGDKDVSAALDQAFVWHIPSTVTQTINGRVKVIRGPGWPRVDKDPPPGINELILARRVLTKHKRDIDQFVTAIQSMKIESDTEMSWSPKLMFLRAIVESQDGNRKAAARDMAVVAKIAASPIGSQQCLQVLNRALAWKILDRSGRIIVAKALAGNASNDELAETIAQGLSYYLPIFCDTRKLDQYDLTPGPRAISAGDMLRSGSSYDGPATMKLVAKVQEDLLQKPELKMPQTDIYFAAAPHPLWPGQAYHESGAPYSIFSPEQSKSWRSTPNSVGVVIAENYARDLLRSSYQMRSFRWQCEHTRAAYLAR